MADIKGQSRGSNLTDEDRSKGDQHSHDNQYPSNDTSPQGSKGGSRSGEDVDEETSM